VKKLPDRCRNENERPTEKFNNPQAIDRDNCGESRVLDSFAVTHDELRGSLRAI
jgi:hypothetical protein